MKHTIRILAFFLNSSEYGKHVGGVARRFLEVTEHLRKLGVETYALEYNPSLAAKWGYSGYHSIGINRTNGNHTLIETIIMILQGIKACVTKKCDIIYVPNSGVFGYNSVINLFSAYIVSLLYRKPLVVVFHHLTQIDYTNKNVIKCLAYKHAKVCVAVSQATATDVKKTYDVRRLVVANNGVNLDVFRQIRSQQKMYDAVFLGRMVDEKGVFTFLETWKIVTAQMPSAQLLLLGGTTEHTKDACESAISKLGLERNVTISGFVSDQEVIRLLKSSQIFVFPSKAEGFGLVVVEAMAAGLPCILSNLPALKENFNSAAIFVEPDDSEGLAKAFLALFSDDEQRRKLTKRGQALVKQFSWDKVAKTELEVFESLVKH